MEELRAFWKERAAIEDDYAKRLAKLARMSLGRDEIGYGCSSLDYPGRSANGSGKTRRHIWGIRVSTLGYLNSLRFISPIASPPY